VTASLIPGRCPGFCRSLTAKLVLQILRADVAKDSSDGKVQELNDELISAMAHDPNASHLLEVCSPETNVCWTKGFTGLLCFSLVGFLYRHLISGVACLTHALTAATRKAYVEP
jgi:hypothetical protein